MPDGLKQKVQGEIPFEVYLELRKHLKVTGQKMKDYVAEAVIERREREKQEELARDRRSTFEVTK